MRLLRPHIPIQTQCLIALKQLGELWPDDVLAANRNKKDLLDRLLDQLSELLGAEHLQLDHNPALALRDKVFSNGVHIEYKPHSCDPEFLVWRDANAHRIKTNFHGDGAQFSDWALIRRERRRNRKKNAEKSGKRKSNFGVPLAAASGFPKKPSRDKSRTRSAVKKKYRWPKRSFQKRTK
jgi:hypothetical protein